MGEHEGGPVFIIGGVGGGEELTEVSRREEADCISWKSCQRGRKKTTRWRAVAQTAQRLQRKRSVFIPSITGCIPGAVLDSALP